MAIRSHHAIFLLTSFLVILNYQWVQDFEFVGDSEFLIENNRFIQSLSYFWENLTHNYFWSSSGYKVPYWRPVTKGSWVLEYQLFANWTPGYQWVQVLWFLIAIAGVLRLAHRLDFSSPYLLFLGLYLGLNVIAIGPVTMVMARSDVVGLACSVWSFLFWLEMLAGKRSAYLPHIALAILALGSKESSVYLLPLCLFWILCMEPARRRSVTSYVTLSPMVILLVGYFPLRHAVLYQDEKAMAGLSFDLDLLRIFASGAVYLQNAFPFILNSSARDIPFAEAKSLWFLLRGLATFAILGLLCLPLVRKRDYLGFFFLGWFFIALSPVLLPTEIYVPDHEGRYNIADRWLFHALPASGLFWARWLGQHQKIIGPSVLNWLSTLAAAVLLSQSHPNLAEFKNELGFLNNEDRLFYESTPAEFRSESDHCRYFDRQIVRALILEQYTRLVHASEQNWQRCGPSFPRALNWVNGLLRLGLCEKAQTLATYIVSEHGRQGGQFPVHAALAKNCANEAAKLGKADEQAFWDRFQQDMVK